MENVVWMVIMVPVSALFTGIGIYAMRRKKPMWFWSGTTVREEAIRDVAAYNRANGYMWIFFSLPLWVSTFMGLWEKAFAGLFRFGVAVENDKQMSCQAGINLVLIFAVIK